MLLSKESFITKRIYNFAEETCKLPKREEIDEQLSIKLNLLRNKIKSSIKSEKRNERLFSGDNIKLLLEEVTQKILNRLVFIRVCEDREYENRHLEALAKTYKQKSQTLWNGVKNLFRVYDKKDEKTKEGGYDSGLFEESLCDHVFIDDSVLELVIRELYYFEDGTLIDFSKIPSDVFGNLYENYLVSISRNVETQQSYRKSQGIYYTPTYIVDYIVKNTIGEWIKEKKNDIANIKVLDPACGSGSFLIKAYDFLSEDYKKRDKNHVHADIHGFERGVVSYSWKKKIVQNNIFGVDLDPKAVEIAQLNLLLKIAEKGEQLPILKNNIKQGNSLIDDEETDRKNYFKWADTFQEGTFDVVIGNPPYISFYSRMAQKLGIKEREYLSKKYSTVNNPNSRINSIQLFFERAINLVKEKGYIGFIVDRTLLEEKNNQFIREHILKNTSIIKIVPHLEGVFGVTVDVVIIILRKENKQNNRIGWVNNIDLKLNEDMSLVEQKCFNKNKRKEFSFNDLGEIGRKFEEGQPILNVVILKSGANIGGHSEEFLFSYKKTNKCKPVLRGSKNVEIYSIKWSENEKNSFLNYDHDLQYSINKKAEKIDKDSTKKVNLVKLGDGHIDQRFEKPKIIIRQSASRIIAAYDESGYYLLYGLFLLNLRDDSKVALKYILGLLNSELFTYYAIKDKIIIMGDKKQPQIRSEGLKRLKIKFSSPENQQPIIKLVDRMLSLNKRLQDMGDKKTAQTAKLEEEIKKTDEEINDLVYNLYGITEEEKKIIEESMR